MGRQRSSKLNFSHGTRLRITPSNRISVPVWRCPFRLKLDALFAYVVVKDASDLGLAQALRVHIKSLGDAAGRGVDGSRVEEETGAGAAVIPYSQGGIEMAKFDHRAAVESGIEGTEAQDLGFGTAGGGSVDSVSR